MKKTAAIILCLALLVSLTSALASNAGSVANPLISLSYLEGYAQKIEDRVVSYIEGLYSQATERINSVGQEKEESGFTEGFEKITLQEGGYITALENSILVLTGGSAVTDDENIIDLTGGTQKQGVFYLEKYSKYYLPEGSTVWAADNSTFLIDGKPETEEEGTLPARFSFTDTYGHWASAEIAELSSRGIVSGVGNSLFSPDTTMTRAMFVTVLGRYVGIKQARYSESDFDDVPEGEWYTAYVSWAAETELVSGYGNGNFGPNDPITREQMALIIMRFANYMSARLRAVNEDDDFADEDSISSWSVEAVHEARRCGLINGKGGNVFDPQGTASRAEVCTVIYRFIMSYEG